MKSFLDEVALQVLNCSDDFRNVEIIVPNRRTGLFLRKAIGNNLDRTIWMPKITEIQTIFTSNSDLHQAEELLLIYHLYLVFKKHTGTEETFDDFYYWGQIILDDFDDIDKYLVDAEKLFSTIRDLKEIDNNFDGYDEDELEIIKRFWNNINQANISIHKEKFLSLWEKMFNIYNDLGKVLCEKKIGYQGFIYKNVVTNLAGCKFDKTKYIIIGFNALNKCEKSLFRWLKSNRETMFFWDADRYYIKDQYQEAGRFLRDNIRKFEPFEDVGIISNINFETKNIEVITAPSPVSQVKIIPDILDKWIKEPGFEPEKTAIVLGDENLLIPLMYSMPPYIEPYNVSMGFPVKNSATAAWITHLISLQQNAESSRGPDKFYHKDVISLINHSFIKNLYPLESKEIESQILNEKQIYINAAELYLNDFFSKVFCCKHKNVVRLSEYLSDICNQLLNLLAGKEDFNVELEFLNKVNNRITILHECLVSGEVGINKNDIYFKILGNSIKSLSVAFEGEPLVGLQVLGFLETRCLDFDRVIMLSINEGIFPKNNSAQSLIPYNLRRFYELPSIEFQDSIFAYYFYRLIQRAKDIKIVYSSQASDSPSEASRFISQVKYEFDRTKNIFKFRNDGYKININTRLATYSTKTDEISAKIKEHLQSGISPKAVNEYLNCKFKYYLNYIEKIKEPEKIEDEEDGAFFGRLFHEIIHDLYEPYTGQVLTEDKLSKISDKDNIKKATLKSLVKVFNLKSDFEVEKYYNKIIVDIVNKYIYQLLEYDKAKVPFTILGLETVKEFPLSVKDKHGNEHLINVRGIIDRIDQRDGKIYVLDYKTGKTDTKVGDIDKLFMPGRDSVLNTITQVLLYSQMLGDESGFEVCPGILNVNELNSKYDARITINKTCVERYDDELKKDFLSNLINTFTEMLDEDISFTQTDNLKNCKYCPYNIICDRN